MCENEVRENVRPSAAANQIACSSVISCGRTKGEERRSRCMQDESFFISIVSALQHHHISDNYTFYSGSICNSVEPTGHLMTYSEGFKLPETIVGHTSGLSEAGVCVCVCVCAPTSVCCCFKDEK